MLTTGLLLLLALADGPPPAAPGEAGEALTEASLGPNYIGYALFDPGLVAVGRTDVAGNVGPYLVYRTARDALESYDGCRDVDAGDHAQIEAAYQQLVTTQVRHVNAVQWRALQQALRAGRTALPQRKAWQCEAFVDAAPWFDAGLDDALLGASEYARVQAGEGDSRSDVLRPVLGLRMSGPALVEDEPDDGPARRAGMRKGDEVLAVDGIRVRTVYGIGLALKARKPGDRVEVRLRRVEWDGTQPQSRELTAVVELESRAAVMERMKHR
ncbi:TPA: PDZ domain-containing protein [Stenotrophomonas maltophilia]|nr:PDZ domain-containing protein [Stenotrophomonas maltophilia]HDS1041620.1 PDZ domain-containing protein [Stenotrophomonas maltophilia]